MITKTANLFLIKKAGWADDLWYNAKDLVGANDAGDHVGRYVGKAGEAISDLFGGLKKNVANTINGGHDGSFSDRAAVAADILSDKASRVGADLSDKAARLGARLSAKLKDVKARAGRAADAAIDAYNRNEIR